MYTGGVTIHSFRELIRQDPDGIFCGSALTRSVDDSADMRREVEEWINIVAGREEKRETIRQSGKQKKEERKKVVTFGEIMLRLSPPDHQRFVQAGTYDATFGGAEANVATALANFGLDSCFVTALPDHEIGQAAVNLLRSFGVDTRHILRQGKRVGVYFLEHGASQRASKVIYDRARSSVSEIRTGQIDWETVFRDASWFHWSGITPALSDSAAEVVEEALQIAKRIGLTVSVDLNYRKKLWSREKAQSVMSQLMPMVDICIGNEEDAECMFGVRAVNTDVESGQLDIRGYERVARQMVKQFGFQKVALTLRESMNASENGWSACLYNGKEFLHSKEYVIHIVDRVGGGDSFSSGLIYALMTGKTDRAALEFGAAASCLKQTIPGDFNLISVREVEQLAKGKGSGRVQR